MDPGEGGFMADDDFPEEEFEDSDLVEEEDSELEEGEIVYVTGGNDYEIEMEEFAALGVVMGLAQRQRELEHERIVYETTEEAQGLAVCILDIEENPQSAQSIIEKCKTKFETIFKIVKVRRDYSVKMKRQMS